MGNRVVHTGKAWFKTQGALLFIITSVCILGMALIGNPYYIMAGILIGSFRCPAHFRNRNGAAALVFALPGLPETGGEPLPFFGSTWSAIF